MKPQSKLFETLRNPCIYHRAIFRTLDFLYPEASSKSCRTCNMIMHIQSPGIVRTVYSNVFKDILEYSGILMEIQSLFHVLNQGGKGRPPLPFVKIEKSVLILERKALITKCLYRRALFPQPRPPQHTPPPTTHPLPFAKCSILNVHIQHSVFLFRYMPAQLIIFIIIKVYSRILRH